MESFILFFLHFFLRYQSAPKFGDSAVVSSPYVHNKVIYVQSRKSKRAHYSGSCVSPELECACVPLPETDGAVSTRGGQVALGAATQRRKLQTQAVYNKLK